MAGGAGCLTTRWRIEVQGGCPGARPQAHKFVRHNPVYHVLGVERTSPARVGFRTVFFGNKIKGLQIPKVGPAKIMKY